MAAASTKLTTDIDGIFSCPICLEKLKVPKYLPCLHTFCETCIHSYIESTAAYKHQDQTQSEFWINCPVCRTSVTNIDKNITVRTWAKTLPRNHLILSLMDSSLKLGEHRTYMCSCCNTEGKSVPATFWCKQCSEAFCETCNIYHGKFGQFTCHEVLPVEGTKDEYTTLPEIDVPCPFHRGKVFEVYCLDHRKLCCGVCFATQHRNCSDVFSIEDVSRKAGVKRNAGKMLQNLSIIAKAVEKAIGDKHENKNAIDSEKEAELNYITSAIGDIKLLLDKLCKKLKEDVECIHKELRNKLVSSEERLNGFQKTLSNDYQLLKAVIAQGNTNQVFLTSESLRCQVMDQYSHMASYLDTDKEVHINFKRDAVLQSLSDLQSLVDIEVVSTNTTCHRDISEAIVRMDKACQKRCDPMLYDDPFEWITQRTLVINTKEGGETASDIYGATFLEDGKLVVADGENQKLKVYDTNGEFYSSYELEGKPYGVTTANEPHIFFVTHESAENDTSRGCTSKFKLIDTIDIVDTFWVTKATGISDASDRLVLYTGDHIQTVSSQDGTVIDTVSVAQDTRKVEYVAASSELDRLVYKENNSIICRTLKMQELFRYENDQLDSPKGMALDLQGNVYVTSASSNKICQIQNDGSKGRILPLDLQHIETPCCIGFQLDGKTFFIGDYCNGYIEVHTLTRSKK